VDELLEGDELVAMVGDEMFAMMMCCRVKSLGQMWMVCIGISLCETFADVGGEDDRMRGFDSGRLAKKVRWTKLYTQKLESSSGLTRCRVVQQLLAKTVNLLND